ncbi:hypothetical protein FVR03_21720 [Pontibacter qinzhouensis]|uniref:Uncharacterized protein n=1 Tax=Pontibacter qinzhouensis TaxID=2603253 RepID=A0A5C8IZQ7_9BACT|nr:hypothetical protein [Pontibacter qinzhouensis]TXK26544.1 hypothetical protein FVR03_21720 [Pontibacter qinzhouensis]
MNNTPLTNFDINSRESVAAFFKFIIEDLDLNFHPDTPFTDYTCLVTDRPTFTIEAAVHYDILMDDCFMWCDFHREDIYEIAMEALTTSKQ